MTRRHVQEGTERTLRAPSAWLDSGLPEAPPFVCPRRETTDSVASGAAAKICAAGLARGGRKRGDRRVQQEQGQGSINPAQVSRQQPRPTRHGQLTCSRVPRATPLVVVSYHTKRFQTLFFCRRGRPAKVFSVETNKPLFFGGSTSGSRRRRGYVDVVCDL